MQPCYSCSWVRRATLNPEKRGTPGRRGSMYTAFFSLQPMFSPAMMALMRLSICPRLFLICWSSGKPPVPMSSKKALLRDASAFVVMPAVPIWWNVQYSANENGKRRISLYLPIRCVASSLLRSLALLPVTNIFNRCVFLQVAHFGIRITKQIKLEHLWICTKIRTHVFIQTKKCLSLWKTNNMMYVDMHNHRTWSKS